MNKRLLIGLCGLLLLTNAVTCLYGAKIAHNNEQLFEDNQTYLEEVKTLRKAYTALQDYAEKDAIKLNLIKQELKGVDFDYICEMPGGMDLKVQIINQTIGGIK
jgi:hypothetical protein